jgi:hypothetical protein
LHFFGVSGNKNKIGNFLHLLLLLYFFTPLLGNGTDLDWDYSIKYYGKIPFVWMSWFGILAVFCLYFGTE